jgi:hypothetical protein
MFKKNIDIGFDLKWENIPDDDHFKSVMKHAYDLHPMLTPHHRVINGLPIYFNEDDDNISVDLSAGADSTMLFYILATIITTLKVKPKIVVLTMIRFWETKPSIEDNVTVILDYFKEKFPNLDIIRELCFVPPSLESTPMKDITFDNNNKSKFEPHIMEGADAAVYAIDNFNRYIREKYKIKRSYGGTTTNPDIIWTDDSAGPEFRKKRMLSDHDLRMYSMDWPRQDPFLYVQKNWIMAQYENFNITDLRDLTRSCSTIPTVLNTVHGKDNWHVIGSEYVCGVCFFCNERNWAQNNMSLLLQQNHI